MKPFLSVCMIVKNEEKVIRRCLESIKDFADEIIIADTGSEDSTKSIAKEYTRMVYDYKWENDFSKARNFAASKASGEWIMAIDADEYVDSDSFKDFKEKLMDGSPAYNILNVQIVNFLGEKGIQTALNYHERIYKNDGLINYIRSVHELLKHKSGNEERGIADLQFFHSGYMKNTIKEKGKSKRNLSLLKSKKEKEPIDYYFIGNEYHGLGELDKAIEYYKKGYQLRENINYDWVKKLLVRLIICLHTAERSNEALDIIDACEKAFINLVDFKFLKGKILLDEGKIDEPIIIFENILDNKENLIADSSIDYLEYLPHKYLGELYEKENQLRLAVHHYSKTLSINDTDDYIWCKLLNLLAEHSTIDELHHFIHNNCLTRKNMSVIRLIRILLNVSNINVQKLTRIFLNESTLTSDEKEALMLKNLLLDRKIVEIVKILNGRTLNQIVPLLAKRILNPVDFILITLYSNVEEFKRLLYQLKFDGKITNLLDILFGKQIKKLSQKEEVLLISILKLASTLKMDEVANYIYTKTSFLSERGKASLNHLASSSREKTMHIIQK